MLKKRKGIDQRKQRDRKLSPTKIQSSTSQQGQRKNPFASFPA